MLEIGQKAPTFSLPGVDGKTHDLATLLADHKAVVVVFSCNHCPYVRAWEGRMKEIQQEYEAQGVVLTAINANNAVTHPGDSFDAMKERAEQEDFNFLYLRDESQEVAHAYGGTHTPHVFLLDGDGILRYQGAIDDNYDDPDAVSATYLRDALDAMLAGNTPPVTSTKAVGCSIKWKN